MILDIPQVRGYFAPPHGAYWQWLEGDKVVAWRDGTTIAFDAELKVVLARLAPGGLPPLGSILLLMAACRHSWTNPPERPAILRNFLCSLSGDGYEQLLGEVLAGLEKVHKLREHVLMSPASRAVLAEVVFDDAPGRYPAADSLQLLDRLQQGLPEDVRAWKPQSALDDLLYDLGCLRWGLGRADANTLANRLATGLDEPPEPAPIESPPAGTARDLINQLEDDPELGPVARLAKLLLAAVHLPRALSDPEELPIGGVSDVVNRGPLDRLLLSELAYDDMTLAVRVAMNEALYLRRESPPKTPPRQRTVLLDAGIRTWGIPRVFIAAVGLAIAAKSDPHLSIRLLRADAGSTAPIDLRTADGLRVHLGALDHQLHPGPALAALVADAIQPLDESDLVLVTTDDTLADRDFQRALQQSGVPPLFLASVNRAGAFELIHRTSRGRKTVCAATFDLDEVMRPRPKRAGLIDPAKAPDLPAIFREKQFPLRLSVQTDWQRSRRIDPLGVLTYTRDGRFLRWDRTDRGGQQFAESLPEGDLFWAPSRLAGEWLTVVFGKRSRRGLRAYRESCVTGQTQMVTLQIDDDQPRDVIGWQDQLIVGFDRHVNFVSPETGGLLASVPLAGEEMRKGRFVARPVESGRRQWSALSLAPGSTGHVARLEPVWRDTARVVLVALSDVPGLEGPRGITTLGEVFDPVMHAIIAPPLPDHWHIVPPVRVPYLSHDGARAVIECLIADRPHPVDRTFVLDLTNPTLTSAGHVRTGVAEPPLWKFVLPRILHSRFQAIAVTRDRQLVLRSRRRQRWSIVCDVANRQIRFPQKPVDDGAALPWQEFAPVLGFERGYGLFTAVWADGSRAWLDARGLLHLRSSDPAVPECSLVLCDGPMAGWVADGRVFGPEYWLPDRPPVGADVVYHQVIQPFIARTQ